MMRAPSSWPSPSPVSIMTPRNGASTNVVLPSKLTFSDSKPNFQRTTSDNRRFSYSTCDKENQTEGLGILASPNNVPIHHSHCSQSGQILDSLLKATSSTTTSRTTSNRSVAKNLEKGHDSFLIDDDEQDQATNPGTDNLSSVLPSTTSVTTASGESSSIVQCGKAFWLNLLENQSDPSSDDGDAKSSLTPMGRMIQRTSTIGSPLSDASVYDTQERPPEDLDQDDEDPSTNIPNSEIVAVVEPGTSKTKLPVDIMSPVQAVRLRFEQQAQISAARQALMQNPSPQRKSFPPNNRQPKNYHAEKVNTVREGIASSKGLKSDSKSTTGDVSASPDSMIEIGGPFSTTYSISSETPSHSNEYKDSSYIADHKSRNQDECKRESNKGDENEEKTSSEAPMTPFQRARRNFSSTTVHAPQTAPPKLRAIPMKMWSSKKPTVEINKKPQVPSPSKETNNATDQEFHQILKAWRNKLDSRVSSDNPSRATSHQPEQSFSTSKVPAEKGFKQYQAFADPEQARIAKMLQSFEQDNFDRIKKIMVQEPESNETLHPFVDSDIFEDSFIEYEEPSRALVILENNDAFQIMVGESRSSDTNPDELKIRNLALVPFNRHSQIVEHRPCECSGSVFSGNEDLASFFLPQMGMACTCGRLRPMGFVNPDDPTALENVMRPWQVEFLKSFGIHRGEQLVKARHRSGGILAKALRQWRKKHDMLSFRTSSCAMAIDIWAKTCKIYVRSIRRQINAGQDLLESRPDDVMKQLVHFVGNLPPAPKKHNDFIVGDIEPESEMEV